MSRIRRAHRSGSSSLGNQRRYAIRWLERQFGKSISVGDSLIINNRFQCDKIIRACKISGIKFKVIELQDGLFKIYFLSDGGKFPPPKSGSCS